MLCESAYICQNSDIASFTTFDGTAVRNFRRVGIAECVTMKIHGRKIRSVFERNGIFDAYVVPTNESHQRLNERKQI
jgi:hypothetical protein